MKTKKVGQAPAFFGLKGLRNGQVFSSMIFVRWCKIANLLLTFPYEHSNALLFLFVLFIVLIDNTLIWLNFTLLDWFSW